MFDRLTGAHRINADLADWILLVIEQVCVSTLPTQQRLTTCDN
jgi:hypothetical protein